MLVEHHVDDDLQLCCAFIGQKLFKLVFGFNIDEQQDCESIRLSVVAFELNFLFVLILTITIYYRFYFFDQFNVFRTRLVCV